MNLDYTFFGFTCMKCNYKCARRSDLQKHFQTKKHQRNVGLRDKVDVSDPPISLEKEDDVENDTTKKINSNKPLYTTKENQIVIPHIPQPRSALLNIAQSMGNHTCVCGKTYKHMSSLCKHRKKYNCQPSDTMSKSVLNVEVEEKEKQITDTSNQVAVIKSTSSYDDVSFNSILNIISDQAKRNDELKEILLEQSKQLVKISENANSVVTNNVTNNNNTVNAKINFNLFLNNECKDAMNIMDFIDSLPVNTQDLENFGNFGFVEGVTRVLLNGLKQLDIYKRPIHCTDIKRDSIYIKDKNVWEKDSDNHDKMKKVIKYVKHKNIKQLPQWQKEHPSYDNVESRAHGQYVKIIDNALGGKDDKEDEQLENKVIKKVGSEVTIPKRMRFKMIYN